MCTTSTSSLHISITTITLTTTTTRRLSHLLPVGVAGVLGVEVGEGGRTLGVMGVVVVVGQGVRVDLRGRGGLQLGEGGSTVPRAAGGDRGLDILEVLHKLLAHP